MRIIFLGTPEIAATVLQVLMSEHEIVAAYTRPDAIRSRGTVTMPTPVKALCEDAGIQVFTPKKFNTPEVIEQIKELEPDVICIVAYGVIIPNSVLEIPRYGCLNVHTSPLPHWRGAAPVERAILNGDKEAGVTVMKVSEVLDSGPIAAVDTIPIEHRYLSDLRQELAIRGGKLMLKVLDMLGRDEVEWVEQTDFDLPYAQKIQKYELYAHEADSALEIDRKVRASSISHPCKIMLAQKGVTLEEVSPVSIDEIFEEVRNLGIGEGRFFRKRLIIGTADGFLEVQRLRPDGKHSMDAQAFCAGIPGVKNSLLQWGSYE